MKIGIKICLNKLILLRLQNLYFLFFLYSGLDFWIDFFFFFFTLTFNYFYYFFK